MAGGNGSGVAVANPATLGPQSYGDPGDAVGGRDAKAVAAAMAALNTNQLPPALRQQAIDCQRALSAGKPCDQSYYLVKAVYFNAKRYSSTADCLTAASLQGLPLMLCRPESLAGYPK